MPQVRALIAVCCGLGVGFVSEQAQAYCRTTTCDPIKEEDGCGITNAGCFSKGKPLYWPDLCVTFGVHKDGSELRGISYERAEQVSRRAFQAWLSADCGGGRTPYFGVVPMGAVECDKLEFNHRGSTSPNAQGPNANIVVFRDSEWPHNDAQSTIALTTITFARRSGEILDADIEVNSATVELSTGDTNVTSDLQSILTHEFGHFLGLAHSLERSATMNRNYDRGDTSFRTLSKDDSAGICAIYPPQEGPVTDCTGEEPRFGFSRYCGTPDEADAGCLCSFPGKPHQEPRSGWWAFLIAGLLGWRRRLHG